MNHYWSVGLAVTSVQSQRVKVPVKTSDVSLAAMLIIVTLPVSDPTANTLPSVSTFAGMNTESISTNKKAGLKSADQSQAWKLTNWSSRHLGRV